MDFVFYDIETSGLSKAFDQILQFAAIRTDAEFNELDRFEIRCKLIPHIVPSPGAMRATKVTVKQLYEPEVSHYEMIRTIQQKFAAWSPAIFIGYNSIDFDENFLRQAFYQTLHPLYLTNTNGNCRMDALNIMQAAKIYAPHSIIFPSDGSLKLDQVAPANGFDHTNAHDALADVEATIYICKLLSQKAPKVWNSAVTLNHKASVVTFALSTAVFVHSDFYFGKPHSWALTALGVNPNDGAEVYAFDLQVDPTKFMKIQTKQSLSHSRPAGRKREP